MFARTTRLTLRHGWPEDAALLTKAIAHEEVVTKLSRAPWPYALSDAEAFLSQPRSERDAVFLILAHEGGDQPRLIGGIGVQAEEGGFELGYWLTPSAWGRGYATEAGRAVLHAARHALGVRRIFARHFLDNPASGRVLIKLGFRATGEVRPLHSRARGTEVAAACFELDLAEDQAGSMSLAA
jgi:RimJ/RimL family protein N-acetyltransferase